jgi:hypothetical protein
MATWRIASAECCVVRTVPDILGRTRKRLLIKTAWYGTWDYYIHPPAAGLSVDLGGA